MRRNVCAFDFTHSAMLTQDELRNVEQIVNEGNPGELSSGGRYVPRMMTRLPERLPCAVLARNIAEMYVVLRVGVGDAVISQELFGGTHVSWTSEIGSFHIVSEGSVGAWVTAH